MIFAQNKEKTSQELKSMATDLGLCFGWRDGWGNPSLDELCEKYLRGLDFCLLHDYPSVEYMKKHFDGVMQKHGIYVNDAIDLKNPIKIVCNGQTTGTVNYSGYSVGMIYVRHSSRLKVEVYDRAIVNIRIYDNAQVDVLNHSSSARACVILYGGNVEGVGNLRIRDKR